LLRPVPIPNPATAAAPGTSAPFTTARWRWLWVGSVCALAGVTALAAVWLLVPEEHVVSTTVQVAPTSPDALARSRWQAEQLPSILEAQAARLRSRAVLRGALADEQVQGLAIVRCFPDKQRTLSWLEDSLRIDFTDHSGLLTLSLQSDQPEEVAVLLSAITRSYLRQATRARREEAEQRQQRAKKVRERIAEARNRLQEKINERDRLLQGLGLPDVAAVIKKHHDLEQQLRQAQVQLGQQLADLGKLQGQLSVLRGASPAPDTAVVLEAYRQREKQLEPTLLPKLALLAQLDEAVGALRQAGHPEGEIILVQTQRRLAAAQKQVAEQRAALRKDVLRRCQEKVDAGHAALVAQREKEIKPLEQSVKRLAAQVDLLHEDMTASTAAATKLAALTTEVKQAERSLVERKTGPAEPAAAADVHIAPGPQASWVSQTTEQRLLLLLLAPAAAIGAAGGGMAWVAGRTRRSRRPVAVTTRPAPFAASPAPVPLPPVSDPAPPAPAADHVAPADDASAELRAEAAARLQELTEARLELTRLLAQVAELQSQVDRAAAAEARLQAAAAETTWLGQQAAALRLDLARAHRENGQLRQRVAALAAKAEQAAPEADPAVGGAPGHRPEQSPAARREGIAPEREPMPAQSNPGPGPLTQPPASQSVVPPKALEAAWAGPAWPWLDVVARGPAVSAAAPGPDGPQDVSAVQQKFARERAALHRELARLRQKHAELCEALGPKAAAEAAHADVPASCAGASVPPAAASSDQASGSAAES
jgi:hypothetical protein